MSALPTVRRGLVALLLLVLATGAPFLAAAPATAATFDPLHLVHSEQVNGDFLMAGNGVMVCPADDGSPARAECLAASNRQNAFNNNRFEMAYADVDSDTTTYNSSSATVTLPAGSRVTYARLQWGGNRDGQQCGVGDPGAYPPGRSAATQPVRLTVGSGATTDVAPASYTSDVPSIGYYSADSEVTSAFAAAPSGAPVSVTVGNVFAPTGRGCFGGWSLVVVHTDDDAGCAADRRQVFVYDGHVRQGVNDAPIDVPVSGFQVDGQPARVGVTAYEGDNGQTGDLLLVNGTALPDPVTGANNFFSSRADGQLSPAYPNNFSVDAKKIDVPPNVINPGDTRATLTIRTTNDAFMLQSLVLSVPVPSLCLEKSVSPATAHVGDPLTWTLKVSNPTATDAVNVTVDDPAVPACNGQVILLLAAGQSVTTTCSSVATADLTNVATAAGTSAGGTILSATAAASVDVIHPALAVTKSVSTATGVPGQDVTWSVKVQNTGDTPLSPVKIDDAVVPACAKADVGPLAPGAGTTVTCTSTLGAADVTNAVTATGTDSLGLAVTAAATSAVAVVVPAVEVKVVAPDRVEPGDEVKVEVVITDTGATPLAGGTVEVPGFPACDAKDVSVAAGQSVTETCTITVTKDVDTVVKVAVQPQVSGAAAGPLVRTSAPLTVALKNVAAASSGNGDGDGSDGSGSDGKGDGTVSGTNVSATGDGTGVSGLPDTGSPAMLLPAVAAGLLALLGGGLLLVRRRRTPSSSS